jgi:tetratricopeptide (TPR) repeat protein
MRGTALADKGQFNRAVPLLKRATDLAPDVSLYLSNYAIALENTGKRDAAIEIKQRAVEVGQGSDEPQLWYGLGYSLFQACRHREALEAFEHVIAVAKPGTEEYEEAVKGKRYCETNLGR